MGVLFQALEIIFDVQRKRSYEKITRGEISFPTYKTFFIPFLFPLWTPPTFKPRDFFKNNHSKQFKMLYQRHLKFYKSSLKSNSNRIT